MALAAAEVQWGDVASWIGGLATAVALFLTYGLLRITRGEQKALQAEKTEAQARLVSAWTSHLQLAPDRSACSVTVTLKNSGSEPIYGLRVAVGSGWTAKKPDYSELELVYVLPPKSEQDKDTVVQLDTTQNAAGQSTLPVEMLFSDGAGRYWHRDRQGRLSQITKELPPSGETYFFQPAPASI
jgi:hypothetical protein